MKSQKVESKQTTRTSCTRLSKELNSSWQDRHSRQWSNHINWAIPMKSFASTPRRKPPSSPPSFFRGGKSFPRDSSGTVTKGIVQKWRGKKNHSLDANVDSTEPTTYSLSAVPKEICPVAHFTQMHFLRNSPLQGCRLATSARGWPLPSRAYLWVRQLGKVWFDLVKSSFSLGIQLHDLRKEVAFTGTRIVQDRQEIGLPCLSAIERTYRSNLVVLALS